MTLYFNTIRQAVEYSREHNVGTTVVADDWDAALSDFYDSLDTDEEYDSVENGNVLELWAYEPGAKDDTTVRLDVVRSDNAEG